MSAAVTWYLDKKCLTTIIWPKWTPTESGVGLRSAESQVGLVGKRPRCGSIEQRGYSPEILETLTVALDDTRTEEDSHMEDDNSPAGEHSNPSSHLYSTPDGLHRLSKISTIDTLKVRRTTLPEAM
jgi:hypothetical protein